MPGIKYHKYVAMICFCDDSRSMQVAESDNNPLKQPFETISGQFRSICHKYAEGIAKNEVSRGGDFSVPHHLYNPISLFTVGHVDVMSIALLDDFDPFLRFTTDVKLSIEQVSLAFCPTLESLGIDQIPNSPFIELHELFGENGDHVHPLQANGEAKNVDHFFEKFSGNRPLVTTTRIKLGGLAVLKHGLSFQKQIFKTIASNVLESFELLKEYINSNEDNTFELDLVSVNNTRVALLDSQGAEEVTVAIFTSNFAIASLITKRIRGLTFGDVFTGSPSIKELVDNSQVHRNAAIIGSKPRTGKLTQSASSILRDNHLIAATYTTLGVSYSEYMDGCNNCRGVVEAYGRLEINSGHMYDIEEIINDRRSEWEEVNQSDPLELEKTHRLLCGRHDYDISFGWTRKSKAPVIPLDQAFKRIGLLQHSIRESADDQTGGETGILDMSTSLVLPFPKFVNGEKTFLKPVGSQHISLIFVLDEIVKGAFHEDQSVLSIKNLRDSLRKLRLPVQLRRTAEHLFQNMAMWCSSPLYFDTVMDLVDIYYGFHIAIKRLADKPSKQGRKCDSTMIEDSGRILEAIRDATSHRATVVPKGELLDWSVDIRGGLNQLIAGADTVLKCGLGLLKWCWENETPTDISESFTTTDDTLLKGAPFFTVSRMTFVPRTILRHFDWVAEQRCDLSEIEINVSHIVNPLEFVDYIHESAHGILNAVERSSDEFFLDDVTVVQKDRYHELFAEMITILFVFKSDHHVFCKYNAIHYNSHPSFRDQEEKGVTLKAFETLWRNFIVALKFRNSDLWEELCSFSLSQKLRREVEAEFLSFTSQYSVYLGAFADLYHRGDDHRNRIDDFFCHRVRNLLPRTLSIARSLWEIADRIFSGFSQHTSPWCDEKMAGTFSSEISKAISDSSALDQQCLLDICGGQEPDLLVLCCEILYSFVKTQINDICGRSEVHVKRDENGKRYFTKEPNPRNPFLLDSSYPRLYSTDWKLRSKRIGNEISVLKMFWDASTELRSRRFVDLSGIVVGTGQPEP